MASRQELTNERNARFLALLKPIYSDCERWAYSLAQDTADAEDVLAQSILSGLQAFHQLKNEGAFKTWMFRIIRNAHRLLLRSRQHQPEALDPEQLRWLSPKEEKLEERSFRETAIKRALAQLSPDQRQALVLFEMEGFSIREISKVLGKNEGAIRVLLHRSRERLKPLLSQEGISPTPAPKQGR